VRCRPQRQTARPRWHCLKETSAHARVRRGRRRRREGRQQNTGQQTTKQLTTITPGNAGGACKVGNSTGDQHRTNKQPTHRPPSPGKQHRGQRRQQKERTSTCPPATRFRANVLPAGHAPRHKSYLYCAGPQARQVRWAASSPLPPACGACVAGVLPRVLHVRWPTARDSKGSHERGGAQESASAQPAAAAAVYGPGRSESALRDGLMRFQARVGGERGGFEAWTHDVSHESDFPYLLCYMGQRLLTLET